MDIAMGGKRGAAAFIEAIHRPDLDEDAWLDGMIAQLAALVPDAASAFGSVASWQDDVLGLKMERFRSPDSAAGQRVLATAGDLAPTFATDFFGDGGRVSVVSESIQRGAQSAPLAGDHERARRG